jgi:predicted nucleotidyltransferase
MILKLSKKEQLALRKFKASLEKRLGGNLREVRIFGSRAHGNARKDSDIDVLIITATGDWHVSDVIYDIATDILLEDGAFISPKVISEKDYKRLSKLRVPFIKNVAREGITI